jgi:hypothetical protein
MSSAEAAPYEQLAESYEHELELLGSGRLEELAEVSAARAALIASLPETPPAGARPGLERAALVHERVMIEIVRCRDAVLVELAQVDRGRRTARGYAPTRQRRPHIEASA